MFPKEYITTCPENEECKEVPKEQAKCWQAAYSSEWKQSRVKAVSSTNPKWIGPFAVISLCGAPSSPPYKIFKK